MLKTWGFGTLCPISHPLPANKNYYNVEATLHPQPGQSPSYLHSRRPGDTWRWGWTSHSRRWPWLRCWQPSCPGWWTIILLKQTHTQVLAWAGVLGEMVDYSRMKLKIHQLLWLLKSERFGLKGEKNLAKVTLQTNIVGTQTELTSGTLAHWVQNPPAAPNQTTITRKKKKKAGSSSANVDSNHKGHWDSVW